MNLDELNSINFNIYRSRKARSPKGLLLIYPIIATDVKGTSSGNFPLFAYAIDFPDSLRAEKLEYIIDEIMQKEIED